MSTLNLSLLRYQSYLPPSWGSLLWTSLYAPRRQVIPFAPTSKANEACGSALRPILSSYSRAVGGSFLPRGAATQASPPSSVMARAEDDNLHIFAFCRTRDDAAKVQETTKGIAVIEFVRNVLGMSEANSTEFAPATPHPAVVFMPEISTTHKGGTMRLGARRTVLQTMSCISAKLYQQDQYIEERHRHRYEVNPDLVPKLEEAGMHFVGRDETGQRMEILELVNQPADHPYYVAAQFHPEFKSRPGKPSPLFLGFILAASKRLDRYLWSCNSPLSATQT